MLELKKLMLLSFFFTGLCFPAKGQSLSQLQQKAKDFTHTNIDSSLYYWNQVESLAHKEKDTAALTEAFIHLGGLYDFNEKSAQAIKYTELSLQLTKDTATRVDLYIQLARNNYEENSPLADSLFGLSEKLALQYQDSSLISAVYGNWASNKLKQGDLHITIDYYLKAYDYCKEDFPRSTICFNIASSFLLVDNVKRANEYVQEGIKICERNNYKIRNYIPAIVYAKTLMAQGDYLKALEELDRVIKYTSEKKIISILAQAHNLYSIVAFRTSDFVTARNYSDKAMIHLDKLTTNIQCQVLNQRAQILIQDKQYTGALTISSKTFAIAQQYNIPLQAKEAKFYSAKAHDYLNQPDQAFTAFKHASHLNDSLFQSKQISLLNHLEAQHKRAEQTTAIAFLDGQNEVQKQNSPSKKSSLLLVEFPLP